MIDGILLGNTAATTAAPAGLLNALTTLTPTAGGGSSALLGDIRKLFAAIAPALVPVLIVNSVQAASIATLAASPLPIIAAPLLPADQVIAVDASCFASAVGVPDFLISEDPVVHMESTAPLPIVGGTAQPPVIGSEAAPATSLFQTAAIGMRSLIDCP